MGMIDVSSDILAKKAPRVLIVDDDPAMQRLIAECINGHNMRAVVASDGQAMFRAIAAREPDLIILDLHLGTDDGLDLLRNLRTRSVVPVILITGHRREEIDRIIGLELGADDYITKPFSLRELLARSRALLRRRTMDTLHPVRREEQRYTFLGWQFDQRARQLTTPAGETVTITKGEFALLSAFVAAPRRPLSREHLLQATRVHEDVYDRSIDVQILRLRRKLEIDASNPQLIRTERGVGYIFDADVQLV
ncbi:response regulator [Sphingomonas sp. H39-1-10]|uniref:response regulator n=1 Tax=Sphingomonas TaxID=13687 RepID=UPI000887BFB6|nr:MULTISPECIES: response regulator [Sphingomonas]MDF0487870.1 response regulator [Sphingomonas pollutisoli]SDA24677.1 DNA-binding response regulator, OmpR family, contains REC and winged-helix (wHTH) domain [Sphingomonas sp. NFR15]